LIEFADPWFHEGSLSPEQIRRLAARPRWLAGLLWRPDVQQGMIALVRHGEWWEREGEQAIPVLLRWAAPEGRTALAESAFGAATADLEGNDAARARRLLALCDKVAPELAGRRPAELADRAIELTAAAVAKPDLPSARRLQEFAEALVPNAAGEQLATLFQRVPPGDYGDEMLGWLLRRWVRATPRPTLEAIGPWLEAETAGRFGWLLGQPLPAEWRGEVRRRAIWRIANNNAIGPDWLEMLRERRDELVGEVGELAVVQDQRWAEAATTFCRVLAAAEYRIPATAGARDPIAREVLLAQLGRSGGAAVAVAVLEGTAYPADLVSELVERHWAQMRALLGDGADLGTLVGRYIEGIEFTRLEQARTFRALMQLVAWDDGLRQGKEGVPPWLEQAQWPARLQACWALADTLNRVVWQGSLEGAIDDDLGYAVGLLGHWRSQIAAALVPRFVALVRDEADLVAFVTALAGPLTGDRSGWVLFEKLVRAAMAAGVLYRDQEFYAAYARNRSTPPYILKLLRDYGVRGADPGAAATAQHTWANANHGAKAGAGVHRGSEQPGVAWGTTDRPPPPPASLPPPPVAVPAQPRVEEGWDDETSGGVMVEDGGRGRGAVAADDSRQHGPTWWQRAWPRRRMDKREGDEDPQAVEDLDRFVRGMRIDRCTHPSAMAALERAQASPMVADETRWLARAWLGVGNFLMDGRPGAERLRALGAVLRGGPTGLRSGTELEDGLLPHVLAALPERREGTAIRDLADGLLGSEGELLARLIGFGTAREARGEGPLSSRRTLAHCVAYGLAFALPGAQARGDRRGADALERAIADWKKRAYDSQEWMLARPTQWADPTLIPWFDGLRAKKRK
jgi:hypothetical protein